MQAERSVLLLQNIKASEVYLLIHTVNYMTQLYGVPLVTGRLSGEIENSHAVINAVQNRAERFLWA